MQKRLISLVEAFRKLRVLVVGDFFLDKYLIIDPALDEPSLETGLTAYQVMGKRLYPGAAGTVTNNLTALKTGCVQALGIIGDDGEGYELLRGLTASGVDTQHLIRSSARVTPTYTKPMVIEASGERELNRQDIKNQTPTPPALEDMIIERLRELCPDMDAVIALDQVVESGRGVLTPRVRETLMELGRAQCCPVMYADSRAFIAEFRDIIVKCNHIEAAQAVNGPTDEDSARECAMRLFERNQRPAFITRGAAGMWVAQREGLTEAAGISVPGPVDICGAGDAATSGIVLALAAGATPLEAAYMGNAVASITIQQLGVTGTATPEQLKQRIASAYA